MAVIVVIGGGVWLASSRNPGESPATSEEVATTDTTIEIKDFTYQPATLTVQPGEKITVVNRDIAGHSVTSDDGTSFDSKVLSKDQSVVFTAPTKPGSYPFFCIPHPSIKGVLIVEGNDVATPMPEATAGVSPGVTIFHPQTFTAIKSAHFVSSEPANNAVLTTAPSNVKVNFNFDLAANSKITVTRGGVDVTAGSTTIATDKLSMSVPVSARQTGNYQVNYTGCWPDQSCHNGSFGFSVQLIP